MISRDPLARLGVTVDAEGGELRIWSAHASAIDLLLYDEKDPTWVARTVPLERDAECVWSARSPLLTPGRRYAVRVDGPAGHRFDPRTALLEPYSRGLHRVAENEWRSVVVDDSFDWGASEKPRTPLDRTVVYEAHVKGLTKLNPALPRSSAAPTRDSRTSRRSPPSSISASRRSSCCRCTRSCRSSGSCARDSPTTGATTRWASSARTRRTPLRPPSAAGRRPCCASSRAWSSCCTRRVSR
ncbi:hypothetical protein Q0F99_18835 [Rathayibacter oskolensis]|nr:hypothetical protein [Rathayibacter oskolensis]WKK71409.1 hypothetical protein Q0F99_18835 [Rathayibacter oskolensis]